MTDPQASSEDLRDRLAEALGEGSLARARALLEELHPGETALLLESLPPAEREALWELLPPGEHPEVYAEAEDALRAERLQRMEPEAVAAIAEDVELDDAADILQDLPEPVVEEVLQAMQAERRRRLEAVLAYDEDTAGGLMNLDVVTVRADVSLEVVARYLRRLGEIPEKTNRLFVVDRENRYLGTLRVADILTSEPELEVAERMREDPPPIPASMPEHEVALLFEQQNLLTAAVVDEEGRVLGRITVDDVVDVIRDEGERSIMGMAGLDEDADLLAPVLRSARGRSLWLGINLATALLAAWVIGLFEATIQQAVALAVMMPVVASMGGIAGGQSLTIVIRGVALGQLRPSNIGWVVRRELLVGVISALLWALAVALVALAWFDSARLGLIVGAAIVINLLVAALAGALLPLALRRLGVDPAIAGGVVLTTITDVVGFFALLGLGSAYLLR